MATFRTLRDLEQSVAAAGLQSHLPAIIATVRPVILFVRAREPDDALPVGTTKLGGHPNLPAGMAWPMRPAYRDAEKRRQRLMKETEASRKFNAQLAEDKTFSLVQRDSFRNLTKSTEAWNKARAEFGFQPFPLAFVAQFSLAALSRDPGFPIEFPDTGLLSIFQDIIGGGEVRVTWHDQPVETLQSAKPPQQLVDWYDRFTPLGLYTSDNEQWRHQTGADVLQPFSALAVPDHWENAYPYDTPLWHAFRNWIGTEAGQKLNYRPEGPLGSQPNLSGNFGDRLGGWPANIQSPPEPDLAAQLIIGNHTIVPGKTTWFHLFSHAGEYYGGTRFMPRAHSGDGTSYILIRDTDLAARRFERIGQDYQMD